MRGMQPGEEVTLEADDPLAKIDLPHAATQAGFLSEDMGEAENGAFRFRITAPKSGKDVPRDWAED